MPVLLLSCRSPAKLPVYFRLKDSWLFDVELALTESSFKDSDNDGDEVPGSVRSGSPTVWNLGFGYTVRRLDFRIDVLNLFDSGDDDTTYYYESRLPGEAAAGVGDLHFHPLEPRTFRAYVTWYNERQCL